MYIQKITLTSSREKLLSQSKSPNDYNAKVSETLIEDKQFFKPVVSVLIDLFIQH